jgi:hypothetical protein
LVRKCRRNAAAASDSSQQSSPHDAIARDLDQRDGLCLSWFEPHRGAGRNVEPAPGRDAAIELERAIGLRKVIVTADLNGPITSVGHLHLHGLAPFIEYEVAVGTSAEDLKKYDTRPPVDQIRKLSNADPAYGFALRKLVDENLSPEEIMKIVQTRQSAAKKK